MLTLYLICQFWAVPVQQQIKIRCQKYGQIGIQLSDSVENIVGKDENVFKSCLLLMHQNEYLWSNGLTLYHTIPTFNDP